MKLHSQLPTNFCLETVLPWINPGTSSSYCRNQHHQYHQTISDFICSPLLIFQFLTYRSLITPSSFLPYLPGCIVFVLYPLGSNLNENSCCLNYFLICLECSMASMAKLVALVHSHIEPRRLSAFILVCGRVTSEAPNCLQHDPGRRGMDCKRLLEHSVCD